MTILTQKMATKKSWKDLTCPARTKSCDTKATYLGRKKKNQTRKNKQQKVKQLLKIKIKRPPSMQPTQILLETEAKARKVVACTA